MINLIQYIKKNILLYIAMFIMVFTWYAYQFYDFLGELGRYREFLNGFDKFNLLFYIPLFILIIFVVYVFSNKTTKDIVKVFLHVWLIFFLAVLILGNLMLLPDHYKQHTRTGISLDMFLNNIKICFNFSSAADNATRWDFGFNYPTVGALAYSSLVLAFVYNYQDKLTKKHHLLILALTMFFYIYSLVRALLIFMVAYLIILFGEDLKKYVDRYGKVTYLIIPFGLIFSFITPLFFEDNKLLNTLTSGRFYFWNYYIKEMPIKLINLNPDITQFQTGSLDNAFLFPIFFVGVIPAILIFIGYTLLIKDTLEKKDYYLLYIFVIWSIYGIIEPTYFYNYNFTLYAMVPVLYAAVKKLIKRIG